MKREKDLLNRAFVIVKTTDNYSISHLQRKLEVGYNRAGNLMKIIKRSLQRKGNRRLVSKKKKTEYYY